MVESAEPETAPPHARGDGAPTQARHGQTAERPDGPRGAGSAAHRGHDHADHAAAFRDRFWISLVLAVPVVVYSEMVQDWLGYSPPAFPGSELVAPLLGTAIFAYGGQPFLTGAASELRERRPGMMLLAGPWRTSSTLVSCAPSPCS